MVTCRQGLSSQGEPPWDVHPLHATPRGPFFQLAGRRSRKAAKCSSASNRSRLRTKPTHATTDKHRFTQIEINSQSVCICGLNCHSRNVVNGYLGKEDLAKSATTPQSPSGIPLACLIALKAPQFIFGCKFVKRVL